MKKGCVLINSCNGSKRVYHPVTFGDLNIGILKYSLEKVTTKMTTVQISKGYFKSKSQIFILFTTLLDDAIIAELGKSKELTNQYNYNKIHCMTIKG